jgi:hypothetical protein
MQTGYKNSARPRKENLPHIQKSNATGISIDIQNETGYNTKYPLNKE